jgi:NADPH2:quinone reductase
MTMRAWLMDSYDGVEKLRLDEVPEPQAAEGEVVLKVLFAALNPADAFLAEALYPAKPALPHVLGRSGVGEVVALGPGVANCKVGDVTGILSPDCGIERWGTLADKVAVQAGCLLPLPQGWSLEELAGAPLVFLSAYQALTQWSEPASAPAAGSVVLVTGASGGVGSATVLLAKAMGLTVVALTRSAQKGERLKELGADFVFDPNRKDLRKAVKAALAPRQVALAVDSVGGALFNELLGMLGYGGRLSVVGRSAGTVPEMNTATLFFRRIRIGGVFVGDYTVDQAKEAWARIVELLQRAGTRPVVDSVFPFAEVKAAFARQKEGPMGKVLVQVAGS